MNRIKLKTVLKSIILIVVITVSSFKSYSQNISEQLGAVKTNFSFSSDNNTLNVKSQIIVKRGMYNKDYDSRTKAAYGYGLQSLHLEFISHDKLKKIYQKGRWGELPTINFNLKFINKNNEVIFEKKVEENTISENTYNNLFIYSVNLYSIPVILLDDTERIDIIKITNDK
jgi:hypothetical protein